MLTAALARVISVQSHHLVHGNLFECQSPLPHQAFENTHITWVYSHDDLDIYVDAMCEPGRKTGEREREREGEEQSSGECVTEGV